MEDAGIFLGHEKKKTEGFFGLWKKNYGIFLGMLKKVVIFLGRQILKLWFFGYKIWTSVGPLSLKFVSKAPGAKSVSHIINNHIFWFSGQYNVQYVIYVYYYYLQLYNISLYM